MPEISDRKKLIEEKIQKTEEAAVISRSVIREAVKGYLLTEKGYGPGDIETDRPFQIFLDGKSESTSVDYVVNVAGRRLMAIKCSPGALESRERHLISFARVVGEYQIPLIVVTDGVRARLLDSVTGRLVGEGLNALPAKDQAAEMIKTIHFMPYPAERREKETRILLAFDAIKCTEESPE
ncbi:MAG TPA: type I restriction enzyme HsdR N-terminal domain-containing protein [Thermodesulfovibrionales bacterium]|jgi:hypothetical protein|nr:type I restriction enzyme HsdR N-terminal domain-containing protein [Thermodesulfovibrionales bacterium]